jgi:hypothetical protein
MTGETIEVVVVDGGIQHEALKAFEGRRLTVTFAPASNGRNGAAPAREGDNAAEVAPAEQQQPAQEKEAAAASGAKPAEYYPPKPTMIRAEDVAAATPALRDDEDGEEYPPEWLDVEKDFILEMPSNWQPLPPGTKIVDRGRGEPTLIFPEEFISE